LPHEVFCFFKQFVLEHVVALAYREMHSDALGKPGPCYKRRSTQIAAAAAAA